MKREVPREYWQLLEERGLFQDISGPGSTVTLRGMLVGGLMSMGIAVGAPYTTMLLRGTPMGFSSSTPAAFFLLFVFMTTVHLLLRRIWPHGAFTRGELITIMIMMMVATAIPTRGVTGMLLPMISGAYYYASPENKWAELIHPHLAEWTLVSDPEAVRGFYEGAGGEPHIPWSAWLPGLLAWLLFYAAFYLMLISLLAILRRQWVEHERLPFPIAQVPLAMFEEGNSGSVIPPFFRNRSMWLGFAIPLLVGFLNGLHHYYPQVATINLSAQFELFRGTPLRFGLNFLMLGFAYFINISIAFSLWFFYLLWVVENHFIGVMGLNTARAELGPWSHSFAGHQGMGALIALVASGLWFGRDHLRQVWRKGMGFDRSADDSGEIMSYRSALLGFLVGAVGMGVWLWQAGLPGWIAPLFVFAALVIFTGLTRAVVEGGLPTISPAMVPAGFVVTAVGVPALGAAGMVATGHSLIWSGELLVFMMAPLANGMRLGSETGGNRRRLFWAIGIAMLISLAISVWFTLHLAYKHGAVNLHRQFSVTFATYPAKFALQKLNDPTGPSLVGWLWMLGGGIVMGLLIVARQRFVGWGLHPLGFAVAPGWTMGVLWSSIMLAWLIKRTILKYGGAKLYERTKPFFMGLIMGQLAIGGLWLIIDSFTGSVGNVIPVFY